MLRVFLVVSVCVVSPLTLASDSPREEVSQAKDTSVSTAGWLAEADVKDGPRILKKKLGATRSKMLERTGLRKGLKGKDKKGEGKGSGEGEENARADEPPPTAPVDRVTASKSSRKSSRKSSKRKKEKEKEKKKASSKAKKYNFEFAKAEIMDVVKAISNMTGKNFIVPEKIKGQRITILSPTLITEKEAYRVFLAALHISGVTIVKSGKFLKLVSDKNAVKSTIPTCVGSDDHCPEYTDQMVTRLIHLNNIEVNQITSVLKSLISKGGTMTPFLPSNALIVSEYAPNLRRMMKILGALDVPGFDDELQIVQIEYATAAEIASKLTQIFDIQGRGSKNSRSKSKSSSKKGGLDSDSGDVQISKIIPDERTNQLIIKANRRSFKAIKQLIAKLDVPISESEQGRVHVYYLNNAKAEELSSTLSSLAQGASGKSKGRAGKSKRSKSSTNASAMLFEGEVKITADKSTNSLIIVSSAHDYRSLRKIIDKLDRSRRQVYVEAAILEVTTSTSEDASLDWHTPGRFSKADIGDTFGGGNTLGFLQSGPFTQGTSGLSPTLSPAGLVGMAGGSLAGIVGKSFTIPGSDISLPSFGILLKWLQKDSNTQVLSTPHILTMDNEEANIEVGKKIPFQRGGGMGGASSLLNRAGGGAGGAAGLGSMLGGFGGFGQIDRIDVKLKLSLTPQITGNNRVRLEVDQQVEDIIAGQGSKETPSTSSQSVKSVVVMNDQQTVVLGGLMRDRVLESESKVPILGDLPLLGWFFKSKTTSTEKANLLLVLTPYIIDSTEDFQRILERKMEEHREFSASYYGHTQEYRAHIDYSKKSGPLALLGRAVMRETKKIENGGSGADGESLIKPDAPASSGPSSEVEEEDESAGGGFLSEVFIDG